MSNDVPIHDEGECHECDAIRARLTAESADREQVIRKVSTYGASSADLDVLCPPNRWAAFTRDELHCLNDSVFIADQHERERTGQQMGTTPAALSVELQAELERRLA